MQLSRARFLSSDRTMCHGACLVVGGVEHPVARAGVVVPSLAEGRSIGLSFHWRSGSSMRASKRRSCSSLLTSSQYLISDDPALDDVLSTDGTEFEEALRTVPWCRSP